MEVKLAAAEEGKVQMKTAHLDIMNAKDAEIKRLTATVESLTARIEQEQTYGREHFARADKYEGLYNVNRADHQRMFEEMLQTMRDMGGHNRRQVCQNLMVAGGGWAWGGG